MSDAHAAASSRTRRRRASARTQQALARAVEVFDREVAAAQRPGGSWRRTPDASLHASLRAAGRMWENRHDWMLDLRAWAESDESIEARTQHQGIKRAPELVVAVETLIAVGLFLATVANSDGTSVAVSNKTTADTIGMSVATVKRARLALRTGGFEVLLVRGGRLLAHERAEAAATHGGRQWKCGSTTVLTHPRSRSRRTSEPLPRRGHLERNSHPTEMVTQQPSAADAGKKKPRRRARRSTSRSYSLATKRFASELVRRHPYLYPWSADAEARPHFNQVCAMVAQTGVDVDRWTVGDLDEALNVAAAGLGYEPGSQRARDPQRHFVHSARLAVELARRSGWTPPSERIRAASAERAERHTRQERERLEAVAERRRLLADDDANAAAEAFFASVRTDAGVRHSTFARHAQFSRRSPSAARAAAAAELDALRARLADGQAPTSTNVDEPTSTPAHSAQRRDEHDARSRDSSLSTAQRANR